MSNSTLFRCWRAEIWLGLLTVGLLTDSTALAAPMSAQEMFHPKVIIRDSKFLLGEAEALMNVDLDKAEMKLKSLLQMDPSNSRAVADLKEIQGIRKTYQPVILSKREEASQSIRGPKFEFRTATNLVSESRWCAAVIETDKQIYVRQERMVIKMSIYSRYPVEMFNAMFPRGGAYPGVMAVYDQGTNYLGNLFAPLPEASTWARTAEWTRVPAMSTIESSISAHAGRVGEIVVSGTQYVNGIQPYLPPGDYYFQLLLKPCLFMPHTTNEEVLSKSDFGLDCYTSTNILFRSNLVKITLTP